MLLWGFCSISQTVDSTYTVPPPENYVIFTDSLDMVEAATTNPAGLLLTFDTAYAISLDEISKDLSFVPYVPDQVIANRLKAIESTIPLHFNDKVRGFVDFFTVRRRQFTMNMLQRKNMYFPMFERVFAEYGVPDELKYLSIVESALIPTALSKAGAKGLWQFMPYTGKLFNLKQDYYIDERMDPVKSTYAAAKYLKYLHNFFGDWELALAAYNCGPGNVKKAQRRSQKFYFWDIYDHLPRETRSYVPQFVAVMYALSYADEHNLLQDQPYYAIPSEEIYLDHAVDLNKLALSLNVCLEDLRLLNPELRHDFVPDGMKGYALRIPSARFELMAANREAILDSAKYTGKASAPRYAAASNSSNAHYHIVRSGETLGHIATKNGVSVAKIKEWNGLRNDMIRPGQKLVIQGGSASVATTTSGKTQAKPDTKTSTKNNVAAAPKPSATVTNVTSTKAASAPQSGKASGNSQQSVGTGAKKQPVIYTVRAGDTLWQIGQKFSVPVETIKKLNQLKSNNLQPGQKLKVSN